MPANVRPRVLVYRSIPGFFVKGLSALIPTPWRGTTGTATCECANVTHRIIERMTAPHRCHRVPPSDYKSRDHHHSSALAPFTLPHPPSDSRAQPWLIPTLPSPPPSRPLLAHLPRPTGPRSLQVTMFSSTLSPCKSTPSPTHVPRYSSRRFTRFVPPIPVLLSKSPQRVSYLLLTSLLQNAASEQVN